MSSSKPLLLLLGEARGEHEARINSSFVGASGIELLRMLAEAGIIELTKIDGEYISKFFNTGDPVHTEMVWRLHPEVYRANVFNLHPLGNDLATLCGPKAEGIVGFGPLVKSGYLRAEFQPELERLADEILSIDPNLIVALGNTALWSLCNTTGISKIRGTTRLSSHTVAGYKLLPTYHPASVLRQWENRPIAIADLIKAAREATFPEVRRPPCAVHIPETIDDLETFHASYLTEPRLIAVDVETAGSRITCIGFAVSRDVVLVIPLDDPRRTGRSYWPTLADEQRAWRFIRSVLEDRRLRKTFQNGLYDIAFIWRSVGIAVAGAEHDTMLLHHALQPESLKGLGFLGSIYTDHGPWKTERKKTTTIKRDA